VAAANPRRSARRRGGGNSDLVLGGIDIESGRAAANVALGLGISVILAAQNRRHHVRLLAERVRRRGRRPPWRA
jgi:hypothetical protein